MEDAMMNRWPMYVYFQDMSKAYDHVKLNVLEKAMLRLCIPPPLIKHHRQRENSIIIDVIIGIDRGLGKRKILRNHRWRIHGHQLAVSTTISNIYHIRVLWWHGIDNLFPHRPSSQYYTIVHKRMLRKKLTIDHMRYTYNRMLIPKIEYFSQPTILLCSECDKLSSIIRGLVRT